MTTAGKYTIASVLTNAIADLQSQIEADKVANAARTGKRKRPAPKNPSQPIPPP